MIRKGSSHSHSFQQTPLNRVPPENLTITQPVKKFPISYANWRFITIFATACHWSLSWPRWIQILKHSDKVKNIKCL